MLIIIARNMSRTDFRFLNNLRNKIQFSIISILFISLLLIATATIWLNIRNYRNNQDNILHEKIQSVLVELRHKLAYENELTPYWSARNYNNLDQLLIKFSDVFYSDINLYDPQKGTLLATSRYEIFDLGLQGEKMDPVAYYKLHDEKRAQFIHREKIGNLSYLSAYVPFENADGKLLAYLNLPYFSKQKEFQSALSALIVTIINIYVILFLITIVISIFISNQITRPLELLQQRFRQLKLGDRYEEIFYKRKDEIGSLVEEYNRMVRELEKSVALLAKSERESAWREMAKQIAHEIKNPLTPMRLSVQQLQKIWNEKREDFDKYMDSVSATLIEQIDNLSAIASEFSNFAKMPEVKSEPVDIVDVVRKCVKLFEGNARYSITFHTSDEQLQIQSDREQLSRVLINVIKNGIQSIPEDRQGIIKVELAKKDAEVEIRISDNGRGIPDEVKSKMFMPNFTTKTSGMGLGLAIVKNIIEQLRGKITFTTRIGEGTAFTLQFPL
jgi:two-component system nitrogen regulation sensor histidine kinase NtrY